LEYREYIEYLQASRYLTEEELRNLLKPENYLGTARMKVDAVVRWVEGLIDRF